MSARYLLKPKARLEATRSPVMAMAKMMAMGE
jgi:hypothetical protein